MPFIELKLSYRQDRTVELWITFLVSKTYVLFMRPQKITFLNPNGPYISTSQKKIRNLFLLVILKFCLVLLSSVCNAPSLIPTYLVDRILDFQH